MPQRIPEAVSPTNSVQRTGIRSFLNKYFYTYNLVKTKANSIKPLARFFVGIGLKSQMPGYERLDNNLRPSLRLYPEGLELEWDETMREIKRIDEAVRELSADFAVLFIPAKESIVPEALATTLEYVDYSADDFDLEKPYRKLAEFCEEIAITCIDPSDRLKEAQREGKGPYLRYDLHISAEGHRILADVLASVILEQVIQSNLSEDGSDRGTPEARFVSIPSQE